MDYAKESLKKHYEWQGKIEVISRCPINTREDLSLAYTPGVAQPCLEIEADKSKSYELTRRGNLVAVITDGTAVLGLGDIGPEAAMPVMEGKCCLFKEFANVDAFPICINSKDTDEIVRTIQNISLSFGGINLEDISAPRCFEIERRLKESLDIPIFHDDQHGTAIIVGSAVINSLKLAGKEIEKTTIVINGAGAAGIAIAKLLLSIGVMNIIMCDKDGAIYRGGEFMNDAHREIAQVTNKDNIKGSLADVLKGADIFVGVSKPKLVDEAMIKSMAQKPIVFAMANPTPEIMPDVAKKAGAFIVGTGRSDFPNQINNVLAFPGIFRGVLDVRASEINEEMKIAAATAIANYIPIENLSTENILPSALDRNVAEQVALAVAKAARETKVARI